MLSLGVLTLCRELFGQLRFYCVTECVFMYVCNMFVFKCVCVDLCSWNMCLSSCVYVGPYVFVSVHVCEYVCPSVCVCVCVHVCVHACEGEMHECVFVFSVCLRVA